jgi:hypothetical protein
MSHQTTKPPRNKPSRIRAWHVALCLLLAILFLYNPFFTIQDVSDVPHVRHPHSYRATVASSELRRCTINPVQPLIPATGVLVAAQFIDAPVVVTPLTFTPVPQPDFVAPPQRVVLEDICSRPPPAV